MAKKSKCCPDNVLTLDHVGMTLVGLLLAGFVLMIGHIVYRDGYISGVDCHARKQDVSACLK